VHGKGRALPGNSLHTAPSTVINKVNQIVNEYWRMAMIPAEVHDAPVPCRLPRLLYIRVERAEMSEERHWRARPERS